MPGRALLFASLLTFWPAGLYAQRVTASRIEGQVVWDTVKPSKLAVTADQMLTICCS